MKRRAVFVGLIWSLWAGCSPVQPNSGADEKREVLTAPRFQKAEKAHLQVGGDCLAQGASACLSGVCLHVKPGRDEGYVCSQPCQGDGECPASWRCAQVYPTPKGRLCVPASP